ncbi:ImmA/IrrE family metallo-endopeptidase [Metaclostridioides mangenotii]|uniref:ImmA/IrrE family metallo-endopeptidase n=1 Tax=Metaclostridioides mangenotii TaxID=1540 RepID=UPI0026ED63CA|nr:ImmA/IrrE family metallo-endopeptidase [Clostridioides mangenotii]
MDILEKLQDEAYKKGIKVKEIGFRSNAKGLYKNNRIILNTEKLNTTSEKACVLAEELSHHCNNYGNLLDLNDIASRKQEYKARLAAFNKLIGLSGLINAFEARCRSIHEFAEFLGVTEDFLFEALECYKTKYGKDVNIDNYTIFFEPYFNIVSCLNYKYLR